VEAANLNIPLQSVYLYLHLGYNNYHSTYDPDKLKIFSRIKTPAVGIEFTSKKVFKNSTS